MLKFILYIYIYNLAVFVIADLQTGCLYYTRMHVYVCNMR